MRLQHVEQLDRIENSLLTDIRTKIKPIAVYVKKYNFNRIKLLTVKCDVLHNRCLTWLLTKLKTLTVLFKF